MTILFVTPLQSELDCLAQSLRERGYSFAALQVGRIATQHVPALDMIIARGGHG